MRSSLEYSVLRVQAERDNSERRSVASIFVSSAVLCPIWRSYRMKRGHTFIFVVDRNRPGELITDRETIDPDGFPFVIYTKPVRVDHFAVGY